MNSLLLSHIGFFIPLLGLLLFGFLGRKANGYAYASVLLAFAGLLVSVGVLVLQWNGADIYEQYAWFAIGEIRFNFSFLIDFASSTLFVVVNSVAFLVQLYSLAYMKNDPGKGRYYAWLNLFQMAMLGIVFSGNLFQTFIFWELVGFASYLLIGFWYQKDSASKASQKAFIINRIGDAGFIIALLVLYASLGTLELPLIKQALSQTEIVAGAWILPVNLGDYPSFKIFDSWMLVLVGLGIFLAIASKSAQFPLQTWLPDAMEGPTPVSALIHAATMVAAGVFLLFRTAFLFNPDVLLVLAFAGGITAFIGAFAAFGQFDIKRILAFSTISQLGYMVMAVGVGAPQLAFFHLITHAFFKAGLFLSAGNIIHSMKHSGKLLEAQTQDIRYMGGLRKSMPATHFAFFLCALALIGVPGFSGFLSKDAILSSATALAGIQGGFWGLIPLLAFSSLIMTALYMSRLYRFVFLGFDDKGVHEAGKLEVVVVVMLGLASFGFWFWPGLNPFEAWPLQKLAGYEVVLKNFPPNLKSAFILNKSVEIHTIVSIASLSLIAFSLLAAFRIYKNINRELTPNSIWFKLSSNHFYFDYIQNALIVKPVLFLASSVSKFDKKVIDGAINGLGVFTVVLAHFIHFVDKFIVDGLVKLLVSLGNTFSGLTRRLNNSSIQGFVIAGAGLFLLLLLFLAKYIA